MVAAGCDRDRRRPVCKRSTATGTKLSAVLLLPSCPKSLLPQQLTTPVFNTAHVWPTPAETCGVTPVPNVLLRSKTPAVFGANTEAKLPDTPATTGPSTPKLLPVPISACSTAISVDCDPSDNANTGTDDPTDAATNAPAATTTKRRRRPDLNMTQFLPRTGQQPSDKACPTNDQSQNARNLD